MCITHILVFTMTLLWCGSDPTVWLEGGGDGGGGGRAGRTQECLRSNDGRKACLLYKLQTGQAASDVL